MRKISTLSLMISLLLGINGFSQSITVQQTLTPKQLVEQILLGQGVVASNIKYNGSITAAQTLKVNASYYEDNGTSFPISRGVLLSTGNGMVAQGPNNIGSATNQTGTSIVTDSDLSDIATDVVTNGVVLEFDFVPSGDSISFNYLFASEEYPEFVDAGVSDVFGFFISGPGFAGPYQFGGENIALLPSPPAPPNTFVTIDNVNPVTNSSFYVANDYTSSPLHNAMQYDGRTTLLTARALVQCNQTYHIKLCISNVGDQAWDSGVFLEAESFKTNVVTFSAEPSVVNGFTDTLLAEGCVNSTMYFVRPQSQTDTAYTYVFQVSGTADPNSDIVPIGDTVHFAIGQDSVEVDITTIADGISETDETLIITGYSITECGDTIYNSLTLWITDYYDFDYTVTPDPAKIYCLTDSAQVSVTNIVGSIPPYTYQWSTDINDTTSSTYIFPNDNKQDSIPYYVNVKDGCGHGVIDTVYLVVNQTLTIDTTKSIPTPCGESKGAVVAQVSGITGTTSGTEYTWNGPGATNPSSFNATVWQNIPSGWYYFSVKDLVCTAKDSVFVDISNPPIAQVSGNPLEGPSPLTVAFTNDSQNSNSYLWYYGDGDSLNINDLSGQNHTYTSEEHPYQFDMYLVAYQGACTDTAHLTIVIPDIIPDIVLEPSNVFTPNGDGSNDTWHFSQFENVKNISVTITNRWGNVVHQDSGASVSWNGQDKAGMTVSEGVYFYIYDATDLNDKHFKGHGFIQVITK
jgi:gliding motility-associated-like protein